MSRYVIGIDVGATKVLMGVIEERGKIIDSKFFLTHAKRHYQEIINDIADNCTALLDSIKIKHNDVKGIVIGCPGVIDKKKENVIIAPNLKWENINLKSELEKRLKIPTFLENDVNLLTVGEAIYGAGKGSKVVLGVFIGTGIGGGIVINNRLFDGYNGTAAEFGHIVIGKNGLICGCKQKGCWEAYASTTAIYKRLRRKLKKLKINDADFFKNRDKTKAIHNIFLKNIPELYSFYEVVYEDIAFGLANLVNIFNPEKIVMGGGLIDTFGESILPKLEYYTEKNSMKGTFKGVKIVKSTLKNDSIFYGALALINIRNNETDN